MISAIPINPVPPLNCSTHPLPRVCGDGTEWWGEVSVSTSGRIFPEQDVFARVCMRVHACTPPPTHTQVGARRQQGPYQTVS